MSITVNTTEEKYIKISDLKDSNGNPFSIGQAQTFHEDNWVTILQTAQKEINRSCNSNLKFTSDYWLKTLSLYNSMFRIQAMVKNIKLHGDLPMIDVVSGYKNINRLVLVDGRHRCWANILCGKDSINAKIQHRKRL